MHKYVITIAPDDGAGAGDPSAETTIRVDVSSGHALITEITVRAADGGGLAPGDMPALDLDMLIRAFAGPVGTGQLSSAAAAATATHVGRSRGASRRRAAGAVATGEGRSPVTRAGTTAKAARGPLAKASNGKAARGPAKATTTPSAARAKNEAGAERVRRAYRRMPDPAEVMAVYQQTGTIGGMAEHFGVPRHTATSWARRLRQMGHAIGRG